MYTLWLLSSYAAIAFVTRDPQNMLLNLPIILSGNSFFINCYSQNYSLKVTKIIPEYMYSWMH